MMCSEVVCVCVSECVSSVCSVWGCANDVLRYICVCVCIYTHTHTHSHFIYAMICSGVVCVCEREREREEREREERESESVCVRECVYMCINAHMHAAFSAMMCSGAVCVREREREREERERETRESERVCVRESVCMCINAHTHTLCVFVQRHVALSCTTTSTERRRLIGSPKLQIIFTTKEPLNIGHFCGK